MKALSLIFLLPLLLQMSWAAGTQCVAKGDHRKPKPGELAYQKGDILTIVDTSTVPSSVKRSYGQRLLSVIFFHFPPFDPRL